MTWKRYDDVEADRMLVRSSIVRSVISEPTDERSRDDRQVVCPSEIARSRSKFSAKFVR